MKETLLILTITILFNIATVSAQIVNIPDPIFKAALVGSPNINTNGDAEIQVSEAAAFTGGITVQGMGIYSLIGIEAFTALNALNCSINQLTSLDVSSNSTLTDLNCGNNQLTSLNVSSNVALTQLYCFNNQLTSLNVSSNTALEGLVCEYNHLTSLNVSSNTALYYFHCNNNQLTSLNVASNAVLNVLRCNNNQLTSLNFASNSALAELYCENNLLTSLNVTSNTALSYFYCSYNQLASLNVASNTTLSHFNCSNNQLTSLNMQNGNYNNLFTFSCISNPGLTCIQVDNVAYMNTHWANYKDPWASYSTNCNVGILNYSFSNAVMAYPNPTSGIINLSDYYNVRITDITGKIIIDKENTNNLDIYNQPAGMYFILISGSKGEIILRNKVTKE